MRFSVLYIAKLLAQVHSSLHILDSFIFGNDGGNHVVVSVAKHFVELVRPDEDVLGGLSAAIGRCHDVTHVYASSTIETNLEEIIGQRKLGRFIFDLLSVRFSKCMRVHIFVPLFVMSA